ncbi:MULTISPECIES: hypothetical protein [Saccharopolyspora]|uniref:Uncharacterized protein n=2 Tax=Saccharopolyspora TaxID=1835 RepID=A0ABS5DMR4_9PSEU|nr:MULTISPECIES: hypothetical protein [Saccharopolyspora]MBQ0927525.1 hypothetical protein [Saccharopolyspora endophytica]MEB3371317.1 hypothetical protein [Saccharopolyspora sp. S2-29]
MVIQQLADTALPVLAQIPNPGPVAPPGSEKVIEAVGNVKWGAGVALMVGFFIGLLVWAGGRWVDHHRAGKIGVIMMLCALGGGILYGVGYQLISHFAAGA